MTKRRRPITFAALLLACVLLPAGFFPHEQDERDATGDHHHCVACCLAHFAAIAPTVTTPTAGLDLAARSAPATSRGMRSVATHGAHLTRGPPA